MSRRDQLAIQFLMWLALATFLFGVWAIIMGLRKPSTTPSSEPPKRESSVPGSTN
jgi:hypothetical protein